MSTAIERLKLRYEASIIKKFKDEYGKSNKCICGYCHIISSGDTWQICQVCKKLLKEGSVICCNCFDTMKTDVFISRTIFPRIEKQSLFKHCTRSPRKKVRFNI